MLRLCETRPARRDVKQWVNAGMGGRTLLVHAGACPFGVRNGCPDELPERDKNNQREEKKGQVPDARHLPSARNSSFAHG